MLLISQNLMNYGMDFPDEVVLRVNMAWVDDLEKFRETLDKYNYNFFIDFPSGRIKPPNNRYTMDQLIPIFRSYSNIKYLAISNVESPENILEYRNLIGKNPKIVPKIETVKGINNISKICNQLTAKDYIMLDHDDLFTDVIKRGLSTNDFLNLVNTLVSFCESSNFNLLRTRGVIFSEQI